MKLRISTDWNQIETRLRSNARGLTYQLDFNKMIGNVAIKVSKLSKAEVEARRRKISVSEELIAAVNDEIVLIEEYLLVALLLG